MAIVYLWAKRSEWPIPANANVWLFDAMFNDVRPFQTGPETDSIDPDYTHWMRMNPQFVPLSPELLGPDNTAKSPQQAAEYRAMLEREMKTAPPLLQAMWKLVRLQRKGAA